MSKCALVIGLGQVGSYLCEVLLEKGYEVCGVYPFFDSLTNVKHLNSKINLYKGDLLDYTSIYRIIDKVGPDEIYNEADLDNIGWSKEVPIQSFNTTTMGVIGLLEAVRLFDPDIKVFQPLSITMFGNALPPQSEETKLDPRSPYACAKASTWHVLRFYRNELGLKVYSGIFGNHDSPRRSEDYLLHKICNSAVRIARGEQPYLTVGSLNQEVDIGYAKEYAEASWMITQSDKPDDFVIATGVSWSIGEMIEEAFRVAGVKGDYSNLVKVDLKLGSNGFLGPTYRGDISKAQKILGFYPKYTVKEMISILIEAYKGH